MRRCLHGRGQSAQHIVLHAFCRVVLDQRHMLVSCCVVDRVRLPGAQNLCHARGIAHIGQQRYQSKGWHTLFGHGALQFMLNRIQRKLRQLHQQQRRRPGLDNLPAQLRANRAPRPRHHHHLAGNVLSQHQWVGRHRVAAQQVFNVQLFQVRHLHLALRQLHHPRQCTHLYMGRTHQLQNFVAPSARHRRNGQKHLRHAQLVHHAHNSSRIVNLEAIEHLPVQTVIVVQQTHNYQLGAGLQGRRQLPPCRARAINQHLRQSTAAHNPLVNAPQPITHKRPRQRHAQQQQQRLQQAHRARHARHAHHSKRQTIKHGVKRHRLQHRHQSRQTRITKDGPVQTKDNEQWQGKSHRTGKSREMRWRPRCPRLEPQIERHPHRDSADKCVRP